jgi:hypothetical protein
MGKSFREQLWDYMVKAAALAPNNPRVVFGKAEFEIEQRSFGNRYKTHVLNRKSYRTFATLNPKRCSHQVGD